MTLEPANLGDEHPHGNVVFDDQDPPASARRGCDQPDLGGAKPTRRVSRAARLGRRIRITRFSPPSSTLASSHPSAPASWRTLTTVTPSASWATVSTLVEYSQSLLGSPTEGTIPVAVARAPSGCAGWGSSGSSSGSS